MSYYQSYCEVNKSFVPISMLLSISEESDILNDELEKALQHYFVPFSTELYDPKIKFIELKTQWENDTALLSSIFDISMNYSYQQIIGMGKEAIPFILEELSKNIGHWFWALKSITGEDPVLPEQRGNLNVMTNVWLKWGKEKGYIK